MGVLTIVALAALPVIVPITLAAVSNRDLSACRKSDTLPDIGDVMYDTDHNPKYGDGRVRIVALPAKPAETYYVEKRTGKKSVKWLNRHLNLSGKEPVVEAKYVDGSDKVYAFPLSRLE